MTDQAASATSLDRFLARFGPPRVRVVLWLFFLVLLSFLFSPYIVKGVDSDGMGRLNQANVINKLIRLLASVCQGIALLAALPLLFRPTLRLLWLLSALFAFIRIVAVLVDWYVF
jgi:hypothetical protein